MQGWLCPIDMVQIKALFKHEYDINDFFIGLFLFFYLRVFCKNDLRISCILDAMEKLSVLDIF